jgi:hypothetical protein
MRIVTRSPVDAVTVPPHYAAVVDRYRRPDAGRIESRIGVALVTRIGVALVTVTAAADRGEATAAATATTAAATDRRRRKEKRAVVTSRASHP